MNASELSHALSSPQPPVLLHVLPPEIFEARRIPGSLNACIYETAFPEQVADLIPDKNAAIVVYGAGGGSLDSRVAVERLRGMGYQNVGLFEGGLDGWQETGFDCEGSNEKLSAPVLDGTYRIDVEKSLIRWTGRNLFNQHHGHLRLDSGEVVIDDGKLVSAKFAIDMNSIACDDLDESQGASMLVGHLKTGDFFQVDRFPTAEFVADEVEEIPSASEGTPTHVLKGRFTLRDVTRTIAFPVVIASADGNGLTGQGQLELDRTEFGSIYGSGKFFRHLGKHVVNDLIHLDVMIHAEVDRAE